MLRQLWLIILFTLCLAGCQDIYEQEKYQYPKWQAGKIYAQISVNEQATVFQELLESTGYDTVLNRSGSYTVFVPTDSAFQVWFADHPEFQNTVEMIPSMQREAMVQYHLFQNRWSREQMSMLGNEGWIDPDDPNNNRPTAYKRQTLYRKADKKYWIIPRKDDLNNQQEYIVDSLSAEYNRKVYTDSRKFLPVFFDEFFGINNLVQDDYEFFFDRSYQYGDIHVANARLLGNEIPAENGFINLVDQVILPPDNVEEYLLSDEKGVTTRYFLDNMNRFSRFLPNMPATLRQPEALEGGFYDTLFDLSFGSASYDFPFEIHHELTGSGSERAKQVSTLRHHFGIMIPTDQAFENFLSNTLIGPDRWPDYRSVPDILRWYILKSHMSSRPIYRSTLNTGLINAFGETVELDESDIRDTYYGSNATILLLDKMVEPRGFSGITAPVLLQSGYTITLYALVFSNTLQSLGKDGEFSFYISSDARLENDSSLMVDLTSGNLRFTVYDRTTGIPDARPTSISEVRKRLLNQVGRRIPSGLARKEFIETFGGNYLVMDNETNTISGGSPTTYGYLGDSLLMMEPELIGHYNNGATFQVETWFSTPRTKMYSVLNRYPLFFTLMEKAGLLNTRREEVFLNEAKKHTVFVPSDQALLDYGADTLDNEELARLLKHHFVQGEIIWTHGLEPSGTYPTLLESNSGVGFETLELETGIDFINVIGSDQSVFCHIPENGSLTNNMVAYSSVGTRAGDNRFPGPNDYFILGVVHGIDKVLAPGL